MPKKYLAFEVEFLVEKDGDGFHAWCPSLPGLHVDGSTPEEAIEHAREAAEAYLRSLMKHGEAIPLKCVTVERSRRIPFMPCSTPEPHIKEVSVAVG